MKPTWKEALDIHWGLMRRMSLISIRRNKTFVGECKLYNNILDLYLNMLSMDESSEEYKKKKRLLDKLYRVMYEIQSKLKIIMFEYDLLEIESNYYLKIINDYNSTYEKEDQIWSLTPNTQPVKRITKTKRRELEMETCAICLDIHGYKDIVKTSCGHVFGKTCFQNHLRTLNKHNHSNVLRTGCPMCRRTDLAFTLFALKK
jgi:hypothetical protein